MRPDLFTGVRKFSFFSWLASNLLGHTQKDGPYSKSCQKLFRTFWTPPATLIFYVFKGKKTAFSVMYFLLQLKAARETPLRFTGLYAYNESHSCYMSEVNISTNSLFPFEGGGGVYDKWSQISIFWLRWIRWTVPNHSICSNNGHLKHQIVNFWAHLC